ncbi:hypothetical protein HELRODRAFT_183557 [Helobdella robusta]|uniref:Uncharacterized protein n=1 Tax=Helobdella robusta TaxID=6412 RepID=T1FJU4_HELRO|nr:hypothetical protein HELRODRAFT_183557 [Helobdella robusta]ESO10525.1 hypothetical protein HELRODRAFT_183557 [Helobdella robusta]
MNDYLIFQKAYIPAIKEPAGLISNRNIRPDGYIVTPWSDGRCLTWDVTFPHTLADRYISNTSLKPGSAAIRAADFKNSKYVDLNDDTRLFVPPYVQFTIIITVCVAGFLMLSQGHVPSTTSLTLCHVCYKHFKVRQDGTLVRHGGKVKGSECPGSLKHPPSSRKRRSLNVVNANISKTSEDSRVLDTAVDMKSKSSLAENFFEKSSGCRLVDHVPKQSRGKFGRILKDILKNICDNPSNAILWFRLPFIPRLILRKDLRGGGKKKHQRKN